MIILEESSLKCFFENITLSHMLNSHKKNVIPGSIGKSLFVIMYASAIKMQVANVWATLEVRQETCYAVNKCLVCCKDYGI